MKSVLCCITLVLFFSGCASIHSDPASLNSVIEKPGIIVVIRKVTNEERATIMKRAEVRNKIAQESKAEN